MTFDFSSVVRNDLPPPNARWIGFPEFNFVGGNNDEASVPVDALRAAADAVVIDTTPLDLDEVVERLVTEVENRIGSPGRQRASGGLAP